MLVIQKMMKIKIILTYTKYGVAKRQKVSLFKNMNKAGPKAINLKKMII